MPGVSRRMLTPYRNGRCVFPGFITYISQSKPTLLHRHGWVDASDTYDDFADAISTDNGKTWGEPVMRLQSRPVEGGRLRYAENAALFDASAGKLLTIASRGLYPQAEQVGDIRWSLMFQEYDPAADEWSEPQVNNFGLREGIMISFSFPIQTPDGTVLVPAQKPAVDEQGNDIHLPGYWSRQYQALMLMGKRLDNGNINWKLSKPLGIDPQNSSRGVCEPTIARLSDGRIVMICRGDNGYFPERPGCKWVSFTSDLGQSWSDPQPLMLDSGQLIESSASGSSLIRSKSNGKLYYLANLCTSGQRANGNWPRTPLVLAEVREEPFGLRSDTLRVIDDHRPGESERLQLSNFRYYQDRQSGELCVRLVRYGERSTDNWKDADYYEYRVNLDVA